MTRSIWQAHPPLADPDGAEPVSKTGFQAGINYGITVTSPSAIATADFNGDGVPDLAIANSSSTSRVTILLNNANGTGTFGSGVSYAAGGTNSDPVAIVAADFNGDGSMDVAVANSATNNVSVLLGNGNGTFQAALNSTAGTGTHPMYLVAGDFNRDGLVDLAVADYGSGAVSIMLGKGNGTFQAPLTSSVGTNNQSALSF